MKAKLYMILSMALYGTLSIFIRNIPLTSAEVALFRAVLGLDLHRQPRFVQPQL